MSETRRRVETIRENVAHIARGCRASTSHNPAPYLNSIEAALTALLSDSAASSVSARAGQEHPCPKGDACALNSGAVHCFGCHRNWPRDETWSRKQGEPCGFCEARSLAGAGQVPADTIEKARRRAQREPLDVDISDFSDEWCAGYLAGQVNALDYLAALAAVRTPEEQT